MGPSRAGVETFHSSSNSGIFFQGNMNPNVGPVSTNITNNLTTSGPSITANSMITDANSTLSGSGPPHLQRNTSFNMESYNRLPASPLSFSSNNLSNLGSSVIDSNQDNISQLQKKPRLDIKQEDLIQQQVVQQILQNPNPNPQLQALIQQQRLRQQQQQQQQQLLQSLPPVQRAHLLQQQQLRQLQNGSAVKRPYDNGVCSRRLMQYLYHQRQRPADNSIAYWRKFVVEYYSPRAKTRWCLSLYDNVGHHSLGVFPQSNVDAWQCDICGTKSGRGFEATFEVLPRLNEIKFSSGVTDELLFLDLPRETRFNTGLMMLEYGKAVQESIYDQLRVVRQGQLKVIFTPDLKILNWEFCARRHEELLPRRLIAPQVNQLLQVAQKCQSTIAESGSDGVSQQDLQTNSNMVVTAWRQLARSLELQSLNDLGFSKRYVRCLQISEVVSSMKDLMDLCQETKVGPIEGLKSFPRQGSGPGPFNNRAGPPSGSAQSAITLTNYQNMLMRQKSMNSNSQPESPSVSNPNPNPNPNPNGPFQGLPDNRFPNTQQPPPAQQLSHGGGGGAKPSVSGQTVGPDSNGSTRSNSFKRAQTGPQDIVGEIGSEFNGNEFFNNNDDFEDTIGDFGWKE